MITRKLAEPVLERLEELVEEAADFGHSFIEVKLPGRGDQVERTYGFEEATLRRRREPGTAITSTIGVEIISDGIVKFYPDQKNVRWGYVLNTKKNKEILAAELKNRTFIIQDANILRELQDIAREKNWPTEYVEREVSATEGVIIKEDPVLAEKEREIEELKRQLEEANKAKEEAKPKPLAGKRAAKK